MYSYNLRGNLNSSISFGGRWCEIRTYIAYVCFCSLFYSFVLQAIFRLFRIVFYKHKRLQSFGVFLIAITLQWILSFLFILPHLLLDDFQYLPTEYNCWFGFQNTRGLIMITIILYNNPLTIIFTIYTQIIRYTRRVTQIQQARQQANRRDLIILKRIVILVFIIAGIGLPTVVIVLIYMITKYLMPYAYHLQGLSLSLGVLITSVSLIFITARIRQIFTHNQVRVHPQRIRVAIVPRHNRPHVW
jgi:hypothetical protein